MNARGGGGWRDTILQKEHLREMSLAMASIRESFLLLPVEK